MDERRICRQTEVKTMVTLEAILDRNNLNRAWKQVVKNKGSAGVDGMKVTDLLSHLREHGPELVQAIKEGSYKPQPVLRVLIPKEEKGKFRPLGIPTATDRLVQQAVQQKLSENTNRYSETAVTVSDRTEVATRH